MHKVYRINGMVDFYVDRNQLKSLIGDKMEILNKPVGRCLLLLIERRYEIIEQATFFSEVWNKFGVFVTPNTFYQNISLLRKSLSSVGLGDDVVKTVSRKGLMLSRNVEIEFIDYERKFFLSSSVDLDEYQPLSDIEIEPKAEVEFNSGIEPKLHPEMAPQSEPAMERAEPAIEKVIENDTDVPREQRGERKHHTTYLWFIVGLVCLIVLVYSLYKSNDRVSSYFDDYAYVDQHKGCHVFSNVSAPNEKVLDIIDNDEIYCVVNKYVYITTYDFSTMNSVVQCRFRLDDKNNNNHCVSHLFIGKGMK